MKYGRYLHRHKGSFSLLTLLWAHTGSERPPSSYAHMEKPTPGMGAHVPVAHAGSLASPQAPFTVGFVYRSQIKLKAIFHLQLLILSIVISPVFLLLVDKMYPLPRFLFRFGFILIMTSVYYSLNL